MVSSAAREGKERNLELGVDCSEKRSRTVRHAYLRDLLAFSRNKKPFSLLSPSPGYTDARREQQQQATIRKTQNQQEKYMAAG